MRETKSDGELLSEAWSHNKQLHETFERKDRNWKILVGVLIAALVLLGTAYMARGEAMETLREELSLEQAEKEGRSFQCGDFNVASLDFGGPGNPGDSVVVELIFKDGDGRPLSHCEEFFSIPTGPGF
jgi:hypothetical protein